MNQCSDTSSELCDTNHCGRGVRSNPVFDVLKQEGQTTENPRTSAHTLDVLGIELSTRKLHFAIVYTLCLWARLEAANPSKAWDQDARDARGDLNTSWGLKDSHGSGLDSLPSRSLLGYIFMLWRKCIFLLLNKASSWYKQVFLFIYLVCVCVCVARLRPKGHTSEYTAQRWMSGASQPQLKHSHIHLWNFARSPQAKKNMGLF